MECGRKGDERQNLNIEVKDLALNFQKTRKATYMVFNEGAKWRGLRVSFTLAELKEPRPKHQCPEPGRKDI